LALLSLTDKHQGLFGATQGQHLANQITGFDRVILSANFCPADLGCTESLIDAYAMMLIRRFAPRASSYSVGLQSLVAFSLNFGFFGRLETRL